ncbi:MAG: hypothetical protein ACLT8C_01525 [Akkermansia muciniphila]
MRENRGYFQKDAIRTEADAADIRAARSAGIITGLRTPMAAAASSGTTAGGLFGTDRLIAERRKDLKTEHLLYG